MAAEQREKERFLGLSDREKVTEYSDARFFWNLENSLSLKTKSRTFNFHPGAGMMVNMYSIHTIRLIH